jgi:hypothetical protein
MSWRSVFLSRWQRAHNAPPLALTASIYRVQISILSSSSSPSLVFLCVQKVSRRRRAPSYFVLSPFTALGVIIIAPEIKKRVPFHFAPQQFTFFPLSPSPNSHLIFPPLSCFIPSPLRALSFLFSRRCRVLARNRFDKRKVCARQRKRACRLNYALETFIIRRARDLFCASFYPKMATT